VASKGPCFPCIPSIDETSNDCDDCEKSDYYGNFVVAESCEVGTAGACSCSNAFCATSAPDNLDYFHVTELEHQLGYQRAESHHLPENVAQLFSAEPPTSLLPLQEPVPENKKLPEHGPTCRPHSNDQFNAWLVVFRRLDVTNQGKIKFSHFEREMKAEPALARQLGLPTNAASLDNKGSSLRSQLDCLDLCCFMFTFIVVVAGGFFS
jgi:hypothetical protein